MIFNIYLHFLIFKFRYREDGSVECDEALMPFLGGREGGRDRGRGGGGRGEGGGGGGGGRKGGREGGREEGREGGREEGGGVREAEIKGREGRDD